MNFFGVEPAMLGEVIERLAQLDPKMMVYQGFGHPHSYRGDYADLAFEPQENVTIEMMLQAARFALGKTFMGYKGGAFIMNAGTYCWLARLGELGVPIILGEPDKKLPYILPETGG